MDWQRLWRAGRAWITGLALGVALTACGGGGGGTDAPPAPPPPPAAPQITTQPQAQSAADGAAASFSVTASGSGLAYQWQRNGTAVSGATASTLSLAAVALADDGARFRVVVSNAGGSVTSNEVALTVTPVAPAITTAPAAASVTAGQTASFSVVARGSAPLAYQWLRNGAEIAGATAASHTTGTLTTGDDGASFAVRVSNAAGSITSAAALLSVQAAPVAPQITAQPQAVTVTAGQTATFEVTASGTAPLSYQWRRNGTPIAGATAARYTTPTLSLADDGSLFTVNVSNAVGVATSVDARLTVSAVAPASPLAGRAWTPVVQLAPTVFDRPLVGIADDGSSIVVAATRTPISTFPFALSTPFVILGAPGGAGAVQWSAPQLLSSLGTRSGAPVPGDLQATALRVAPNGRAVILAKGSGGGCPGSTESFPTSCRFVSVLDPVQRTWTPWDVMASLDESQREDRFTVAINARGDLALYFPASAVLNPTARAFWRGASEIPFRSFAIPANGAPTGPQAGELTLDDSGGLVLATGLSQNATTDIVVWRGSVAAGMQGPLVVDTRNAAATFRSLWTGRSGRSFLMWTQNNGTTNSLFGARFDRSSVTVTAEDLGPTLLATLPSQLAASVSDADVLIAPRYNGDTSITTCATLRWPFAADLQLADAPRPCVLATNLFNPFSQDWGSERDGNVLAIANAGFPWATYDAQLNRQINAPIDTSAVASGPGYVTGVRRPAGIRNYQTVLSRSGVGLVVITADIDTWPTPASPNGDGRANVTNLWATYFK